MHTRQAFYHWALPVALTSPDAMDGEHLSCIVAHLPVLIPLVLYSSGLLSSLIKSSVVLFVFISAFHLSICFYLPSHVSASSFLLLLCFALQYFE